MKYTITRKTVPIACGTSLGDERLVRHPKSCGGVLARVTLSRLEEGLGHEGFRCDKCGRGVKRVPEARS